MYLNMSRKILPIILSAIFLGGCSIPFFQKKYGALQITTNPQSEVYLDDEKIGETPFKKEDLKVKEYSVKLIPQQGLEWQTRITLNSNITTVINYEFEQELDYSSGSILTLEPLINSEAVEIALITNPDNAAVKLDGQPKGFAPLQIKNVEAGNHTLVISAPGYKQKQIDIKAVKGHKLTVEIQLAKEKLVDENESTESAETEEDKAIEETSKVTDIDEEKSASPSANIKRPYIEVLDTPTGWLRVRSEPTTAEDNEVSKIYPGEKYQYLDSNDSGWHKIVVEDGTEGWISSRYAELVK